MTKTRPEEDLRLGNIKAAIWKNNTERGARFNVTVTRLYKDGDDWKASDSFGRDDLLVVAKVLDMAHTRIHELQSNARG